jgi:modification methylase
VANERIEAVIPGAYSEEVFAGPKRKRRRVPFGLLVEAGLVSPGQTLFFTKDKRITATIRADGSLICGEISGSIHQVARKLTEAPCNGWEFWLFEDRDGEMKPIDTLRNKYISA